MASLSCADAAQPPLPSRKAKAVSRKPPQRQNRDLLLLLQNPPRQPHQRPLRLPLHPPPLRRPQSPPRPSRPLPLAERFSAARSASSIRTIPRLWCVGAIRRPTKIRPFSNDEGSRKVVLFCSTVVMTTLEGIWPFLQATETYQYL